MFWRRKRQEPEEPLPIDPHEPLLQHLRATYPFGKTPFGVFALIQLIVWTVLQMKEHGYLAASARMKEPQR